MQFRQPHISLSRLFWLGLLSERSNTTVLSSPSELTTTSITTKHGQTRSTLNVKRSRVLQRLERCRNLKEVRRINYLVRRGIRGGIRQVGHRCRSLQSNFRDSRCEGIRNFLEGNESELSLPHLFLSGAYVRTRSELTESSSICRTHERSEREF